MLKIDSPILTLILYFGIVIAAVAFFFGRFEFLSNDFLEYIFYLFYFVIGLSFVLGLCMKKPYKLVFFIFTVALIVWLGLYFVLYAYMVALSGVKN